MTPTLDLEELKRKLVHHKFTLHHIGLYDLMVDALEQQASRIKELEQELEEARKDQARYKWLAPKILAPDYGDNELPGEQIGWRIDNRYAGILGMRNPVFIAGPSIDSAIDAARQKKG